MKVKKFIKSSGKSALRSLGWELRRLPEYRVIPPTLIESPLEALLLRQAGSEIAFQCPIELCKAGHGLGFGGNDWHPFVATLKQYSLNTSLLYQDSILKTYYESWQPASAAEAIIGFHEPPGSLYRLPAYCVLLQPWRSGTPDTVAESISRWDMMDKREHGRADLCWKNHGLSSFGPVSHELGKYEFSRLTDIYNRLKLGYKRNHGDIGVRMVRQGMDYIFLMGGGGLHRAAAMAALGYQSIPAQFKVSHFVTDTKDVAYWPQVRSGLWSKNEALAYVDHLFNFDSRAWADNHGLLDGY